MRSEKGWLEYTAAVLSEAWVSLGCMGLGCHCELVQLWQSLRPGLELWRGYTPPPLPPLPHSQAFTVLLGAKSSPNEHCPRKQIFAACFVDRAYIRPTCRNR